MHWTFVSMHTVTRYAKDCAQKERTTGLQCVHLAPLIVCTNLFVASTPFAMHDIERPWFSVTVAPHQSSVISSEDTTDAVTNSTPKHHVTDAAKSIKPTPACSVPRRRVLVGDIFANGTAVCRVRAFLAFHLSVGRRAQRRLDPNRNFALSDSHLLVGGWKNGWCAVGWLDDALRLVLARVDR